MASITLTSLRARVRMRADVINSGLVTDTVDSLDYLINASIQELWDIIISAFGEDYLTEESTISLVTGTTDYNVPTGMYKLLGVEGVLNDGKRFTMREYNFADRNIYRNFTAPATDHCKYRLFANKIRVLPPPPNGSMIVSYVKGATVLVNGSDSFDGYNGWEEYVIVDAAAKVAELEETDSTPLLLRKQALKQRIEEAAKNRSGLPATIQDTETLNVYDSEF